VLEAGDIPDQHAHGAWNQPPLLSKMFALRLRGHLYYIRVAISVSGAVAGSRFNIAGLFQTTIKEEDFYGATTDAS